MADEIYLRAGDADRERVTAFLSGSLERGFIDTAELSDRLERLNASKTYSDLLGLVSDIPGGRQLVKEAVTRHRRGSPGAPLPAAHFSQPMRRPRRRGRILLVALAVVLVFPIFAGISSLVLKVMFDSAIAMFMPLVAIAVFAWVMLAILRPRRRF